MVKYWWKTTIKQQQYTTGFFGMQFISNEKKCLIYVWHQLKNDQRESGRFPWFWKKTQMHNELYSGQNTQVLITKQHIFAVE